MTLLSAGVGEQFDPALIWYFDSDTQSWTGTPQPVQSAGWLTPGNGSNPSLISPIATSQLVDGHVYGQVRLRVRKTGNPTWDGNLWWKPVAPVTFVSDADGTSNTFQLADRDGNPIASNANVQSIHQTDWQGRVELSDQPRTNWSDNTGPTKWQVGGGVSTITIEPAPGAGPNGEDCWRAYGTTTAFADAVIEAGAQSVPDAQCAFALGIKNNGGQATTFNLKVVANAQHSPNFDITSSWKVYRYAVTAARTQSVFLGVSAVDSTPFDILVYAPQIESPASSTGVFIPTTDSPVTVTDYTVDDTGEVTLAQTPQQHATLDWSGTGTTANGDITTVAETWSGPDAITEPSYDSNGIGLVTENPHWQASVA